MKTIRYYLIGIMLLAVQLVQAQPDTLLAPSTLHLGAGWGTNGGYTTFGIAGQYVQGSIAGGDYTGKIGYLLGDLAQPEVNDPPVAISPSIQFYYELGEVLELDGYDPEGAPIEFEITREPEKGTLSLADGLVTNELIFTPSPGLLPDIVYKDTLEFQVNEVNTNLSSQEALVAFKFLLQDTPHQVTDLTRDGNTFAVHFADTVFNENYGIDVNYYNISDPLNPQFVNIEKSTIANTDLELGTLSASYEFDVNETTHNYLFSEAQVLITVLVTADNGYSSLDTYVIDNNSGGKIRAGEDGDYFVIGSDMTVPENKSVKVQMIAIDFAGFESTPTLEFTTNPGKGVISGLTLVKSNNNLKVWEAKYTSTGDLGGEDNFGFKVYNPFRNVFEDAEVSLSVKAVNDAPKLASIPNQQVDEGDSKLIGLNYSDPDNELTVSASSNNENLLVSIVDGDLSLTPVGNFNGSAVVTVWVEEVDTEEEYLVLRQLNVTVVPVNDSPVLADVTDKSADEDVTIEVPLSATDEDGDVLIFSYYASIDDPTLAYTQFTGNTLKIVPRADAFGSATVTVVADDGSGASNALSNTVSFDVTFDPVNDDPEVIQEIPDQLLVENFPDYTLDMASYFKDVETDIASLSFDATGETNIGISFLNEIATVVSTTEDFSGTETITFTASDGGGGTDASFIVDFVVEAESVTISIGTPLGTIALDEDFEDTPIDISDVFNSGSALSYQLVGNDLFTATVDDVNELIEISSIENVNGTEQLFLIASADGASKLHEFTINISAVNDAPIIEAVADQTINEDGTLSDLVIEVIDPDGDAITTFGVTSSDQGIVDNSNISYELSSQYYTVSATPESNQNGELELTISASDGLLTSDYTLSLNVAAVNDLPYVSGSLSDFDEDGSFSLDITSLFEDVEDDELEFEIDSKPEWMTQNGEELSGTPSNDDVGLSELTITASDLGGSVSATFEFEILNINDAPTRIQEAGSVAIFTGSSFSYDFPTGNFDDVDADDELTYSISDAPEWLTESDNNLSGTPMNEDVDTYEIVFRATDESGAYAEDVLYLEVKIQTYEVEITFSNVTNCEGDASSVTASGAYEYNWYNEDDELIQAGGDTYESTTGETLFVEGVDAQGITTDDKFETSIEPYALPNVEISQSEHTLEVAQVEGYEYVWYKDDAVISGADEATYEATESGVYKVTVESGNGCSATSDAVTITITDDEEEEEEEEEDVLGFEENNEIRLYPVPARDILTVYLPDDWTIGSLRIFNMQGQVVYSQDHIHLSVQELDVSPLDNGIYILSLNQDKKNTQLKFIKE
ncbi:MAG: Ig-like domain-containing protein [Reichenbachiella sp.]|uniref:T9SS type A sorting domain-containing protein n=1 Tax=Reichenbachiella sp. TaxID=2184521 RepID=UPI00329701A0